MPTIGSWGKAFSHERGTPVQVQGLLESNERHFKSGSTWALMKKVGEKRRCAVLTCINAHRPKAGVYLKFESALQGGISGARSTGRGLITGHTVK